MRLLWFVNSEFPDVATYFNRDPMSGGGWWMKELLRRVRGSIELNVVTAQPRYKKKEKITINGVNYYLLPSSMQSNFWQPPNNEIDLCLDVIKDVKPDCIHLFGSERYYGLACISAGVPWVVRLQGLLNSYLKTFFGKISILKFIDKPSTLLSYLSFYARAKVEKRILTAAMYVEGQTTWDENWAKYYNQNVNYYRNFPLIREEFIGDNWRLSSEPRIMSIASTMPYKGLHDLIYALAIVKRKHPNVKLCLAGNLKNKGYGAYLHTLVNKLSLNGNFIVLGHLSAEKLAVEMAHSQVFVIPSYEENESNSLLEAMAGGVPCVAAFTGGMPTMITNSQDGLFYPAGENMMLAGILCELLDDKSLRTKLSENGRATFNLRHNISAIVERTKNMYRDVCVSKL